MREILEVSAKRLGRSLRIWLLSDYSEAHTETLGAGNESIKSSLGSL